MFALLSPKLWLAAALAAALAFSHFTVYRTGKNHVRMEWDLAKATANAEARKLEQRRQSMVAEAGAAAVKREAALRADAARARASVGGLRDAISSTQRVAEQSLAAANLRAAALGELLETCGRSYQELGRAADGHASDVKKLLDAWPK